MLYRTFCIVIFVLLMHFGQVSSHPVQRHALFSRTFNPLTDISWESQALAGNWKISRYDALLRKVGEEQGHDWRLLAAIAYKESRFDPEVLSPRGAVGLMQIMPSVADRYDVNAGMIGDPLTNVTLAGRLLTSIERSLRFGESTTARDRTSIILASYNCGIGHVIDARRLAVKYGADPDNWDEVSTFLCLKSDPAYAADEVIECGVFNGSKETLAFVEGVMGKYDSYCKKVRR